MRKKLHLSVIITMFILIACTAQEDYFSTSSLDIRGMAYISEVHWSGTVDNNGENWNPDDDFIEVRSWHKGDLDIGGWSILVIGQSYLVIQVPEGTILSSKQYYTIGNNTNGAFKNFDLVVSNLKLPSSGIEIDIYDGGGAKHADSADFSHYEIMPAGYDTPALKKSAVRLTDYFGAISSLDSWQTYNANRPNELVRSNYQSSVFASPGNGLGESGETSDEDN